MESAAAYEECFGGTVTEIFLPDPLLARFLVAYNFFGTHSISPCFINPIPNGTLEMYIHFGDSYLLNSDSSRIERFRNFVVGLYELDHKVKVRPCASEYYQGVCIRFTYEGIITLLGLQISESLNNIINLEQIYDNRGRALHENLEDATGNPERARLLDIFFICILSSKYKKNRKLSIIYEYLLQKTGRISIDDMAHTVGLSYRTIHRKFCDEFGICPKEYLKIVRFNNACRLLVQYPLYDIQDIIHYSGYYDQAHFIHEFKSIMKISPGELLKQSNGKFFLTRPFYIEEEELHSPAIHDKKSHSPEYEYAGY
jgi:AraC-like DNA-binding protein